MFINGTLTATFCMNNCLFTTVDNSGKKCILQIWHCAVCNFLHYFSKSSAFTCTYCKYPGNTWRFPFRWFHEHHVSIIGVGDYRNYRMQISWSCVHVTRFLIGFLHGYLFARQRLQIGKVWLGQLCTGKDHYTKQYYLYSTIQHEAAYCITKTIKISR